MSYTIVINIFTLPSPFVGVVKIYPRKIWWQIVCPTSFFLKSQKVEIDVWLMAYCLLVMAHIRHQLSAYLIQKLHMTYCLKTEGESKLLHSSIPLIHPT